MKLLINEYKHWRKAKIGRWRSAYLTVADYIDKLFHRRCNNCDEYNKNHMESYLCDECYDKQGWN